VTEQVKNVTIKDAPCELSDIAMCGYISTFGEVVQDSLRRGTMKGTSIQTGTRYLGVRTVFDRVLLTVTSVARSYSITILRF
jgi:hypothetical protein